MKKIKQNRRLFFNTVLLMLLVSFSACEDNDYDLKDPDSAGVWERFTTTNSGLPGNEIWDLEVDRQGNIWASCYGDGLAKYSNGAWTRFTTSNSDILSNEVTALESTADGGIIVGTTDGIAILSPDGQWTSYKDPLVTIMEIFTVRILSDGSVWVGTLGEGLYIDDESAYSSITGGTSVYAFEEDMEGNIWMGTGAGLFRREGNTWTNISNTGVLPAGPVTSLCIDSKNRLWIGVYGADKVYRRDNSGIYGISLMTGVSGTQIFDICEDRNGDIWFATYGSGLIRYDGIVPHSYKEYNAFTSDVFSEDYVNCIAKDKEGNMWFGLTSRGIVKYTLPID